MSKNIKEEEENNVDISENEANIINLSQNLLLNFCKNYMQQ